MQAKPTTDMLQYILGDFVRQICALVRTRRARHILLLSALESLENSHISCDFPPSQQQNLRAQKTLY